MCSCLSLMYVLLMSAHALPAWAASKGKAYESDGDLMSIFSFPLDCCSNMQDIHLSLIPSALATNYTLVIWAP